MEVEVAVVGGQGVAADVDGDGLAQGKGDALDDGGAFGGGADHTFFVAGEGGIGGRAVGFNGEGALAVGIVVKVGGGVVDRDLGQAVFNVEVLGVGKSAFGAAGHVAVVIVAVAGGGAAGEGCGGVGLGGAIAVGGGLAVVGGAAGDVTGRVVAVAQVIAGQAAVGNGVSIGEAV